MSSPDLARFADWAVPDLRLVLKQPTAEDGSIVASPADEAYARGVEDGRRTAGADAERRILGACQALAGAAESLQAVRAAFTIEAEESLYALATALAHQIVQRELATDPVIVRDLVRRAVEVLPLEGALEIRLNPADLVALGADTDLYAPGGRKLDLRWAPDPTIERGGYLIETSQRVVDGRIDPVLRAMYERLRDG
jgi:flagellar biosynthesis/type III secretory pathway protein FliH